jgi:type I restriction enzyme R subunit
VVLYPKAAGKGDGYAADFKHRFWRASLDHYATYGVDELERGQTYQAPQFVEQFGSFQTIAREYGGAVKLRDDLLAVKHHLYVPMTV